MFSNDPAEFERQNTQAMTDAENSLKRERFEPTGDPAGEWGLVEYWRTGYHEERARAAKYRAALANFYIQCGSSQEPNVVEALGIAREALGIK